MNNTATNNNWADVFNNKDFYPTPNEVIDLMGLDVRGQTVLEPSAGKGNLIEWMKLNGAKDVLFCEINEDLANICKGKARFIKHDFLQVEPQEISHINMLVMNPPFSTSKKHLSHAWEIAPEGCEIVTLFNTDTYEALRYGSELHKVIQDYGNIQHLGDVFKQAERKTGVNISLIKLYKPIYNSNESFEGFYMDAEPEAIQGEGIMQYNKVQALVNGYVAAAKCFDEFKEINERMINICRPVGMDGGFSYTIEYNKTTATKTEFLKALQKKSWKHIFKEMNLSKYLTSGAMDDINKFVETQTKVPFTVKNIYRMFEIIVGTKDQILDRALVEAVDNFTKHTHENRFGVEGWKTNSGYMLNKKFIVNHIFEVAESWHGVNAGKLKVRYSSSANRIEDLVKVICNLTGFDYNKTRSLEQLQKEFKYLEPNRWYTNGFFEVKGFKKGTLHLKFTDDKIWEQLNRSYAKIKGQVLPESAFKQQPTKEYSEPIKKTNVDNSSILNDLINI